MSNHWESSIIQIRVEPVAFASINESFQDLAKALRQSIKCTFTPATPLSVLLQFLVFLQLVPAILILIFNNVNFNLSSTIQCLHGCNGMKFVSPLSVLNFLDLVYFTLHLGKLASLVKAKHKPFVVYHLATRFHSIEVQIPVHTPISSPV